MIIPRPIKAEIETTQKAITEALEGGKVSYASDELLTKITPEKYFTIYKRILWAIKQCAYVELRKRLRGNGGKMTPDFEVEVKDIILSQSRDIRMRMCKNAGIEVTTSDEYYTILQQCYFRHITDPIFTNAFNELRNYNVFLLAKIFEGELIPELENLDIDSATDEMLDTLQDELVKKLGK